MSTDERIVALEQGLAGVQREFFVHLSENNRHMATLNKVITQQKINSRDVDHNLAMLLGVASEQGRSIRAVKDDMDLRFDAVDQQVLKSSDILMKLDERLVKSSKVWKQGLIKCCWYSLH